MFDILTTIQPIVDWYRFAPYLARTGYTIQVIGNKLQHLASHIRLTTVDRKGCAQVNRDSGKTEYQNINRAKRLDLLDELIETHRCTHFKDLKRRITRKQRLTLYRDFGIQWEETAKQCIEAYNEELYNRHTNISFEEYTEENNHFSVCSHPTTLDDPVYDSLLLAVCMYVCM